jgi:hypothetical protein
MMDNPPLRELKDFFFGFERRNRREKVQAFRALAVVVDRS